MVYFLIPAYDEERTIGLLLYRIRKVMEGSRRRWLVLVLDDGSRDGTAEHVESYKRLVPLLLFRHADNRGYGASLDRLLREAARMSRVPERDVAVTIDADFTVDPGPVPDMVKEIEAGADIVIGSTRAPQAADTRPPFRARLFARVLPWIYRSVQPVNGVNDYASSFRAYRIALIKRALRQHPEALVSATGRAAAAQLLLRLAALGAAVREVAAQTRFDIRARPSRFKLRQSMQEHWRLGPASGTGASR